MSDDAAPTAEKPICHVNLASGYRGGERQTELLIRGLADRGWPQRLVLQAGGALAARCRGIANLEIEEVAPNPVSAALAARGSALVHSHEQRSTYVGWLLKRTAGIPFVLTRRIQHVGTGSLARSLAWRSADRIVAVSESIAQSVEARYPALSVAVVHSANADMPNGRTACRKAFAGLDGRTIVGHVGELDHSHKGQGTIIEAARALEDSRPELCFVLVGEGRDEDRFRRAAAGLDNLKFAGFVDNVEDYLAAFDVFVFPSLHEGLGSTLLDAMTFGLPIVASRVGGIPEVVEEGINGLLITPERPDELAAALVRLLDDQDLCTSMARENRAKAAQFTPGRMTDAYEAIYRSILDEKKGSTYRSSSSRCMPIVW